VSLLLCLQTLLAPSLDFRLNYSFGYLLTYRLQTCCLHSTHAADFMAISDSASLQYFLLTEVNLLEDLLPPVCSLEDRVALLKRHETAWNNLELNIYAQFVTSEESHKSHSYCYILQDGYLIYKEVDTARYGIYGCIDLDSSSALPNAEAPWTHTVSPWQQVFTHSRTLYSPQTIT
jgi:hypothetical protein